MSNLRAGDVLKLELVRVIDGRPVSEVVDINADDVRWMSTPELLRHFVGQIERCSQHLDLAEEHAHEAVR